MHSEPLTLVVTSADNAADCHHPSSSGSYQIIYFGHE